MKIYDVPITLQVVMKVKAIDIEQAKQIAEKEIKQSSFSKANIVCVDVKEPVDYEWVFEQITQQLELIFE